MVLELENVVKHTNYGIVMLLLAGISSLKALQGDGSYAPSPVGLSLDVSPIPLGTNATHDPIRVPKPVWARCNSLGATMNPYKITRMNT